MFTVVQQACSLYNKLVVVKCSCQSIPGNFNWSENPSVIPLYILDALDSPRYTASAKLERRPTDDEMTLSEGVFRKGDNYVVDEIYEDGAEMLSTKTGESEIAFHVIGRDIKCAG